MDIDIQDPMHDGNEVLMFVDHDDKSVHCIPVATIATWGELLGLTDQDEIIETILNFDEQPTENVWTPLFEALQENLDELAYHGVPAEYMHDLIDPEVPSPYPNAKAQKKLVAARKAALTKMGKRQRKNKKSVSEFRQSLHEKLNGREQQIERQRTKFLDENSPKYLVEVVDLPQPPAPRPAPPLGTVPELQIHLTEIDASSI